MKNLTTGLLADGFLFLEGPRWHEGRLWVSDMFGKTVYAISEDGERESIAEVKARPSGLGFLPDGTPLIVSMRDRKILKLVEGELLPHADMSELVGGDTNDMVVDSQGNAYVGNFGFELLGGGEPKAANIVRVTADGTCSVVADGLEFPNGAVIRDNVFIVAETWANRLSAFDIAADGSLSNRRVYAALGHYSPDGICLDEDGGIWVASFGTGDFVRVLEGGEVTHLVDVGNCNAVACQLGGADGKTLFCLTFKGDLNDLESGAKPASIETVRVDSAAAGSP